MLWLFSVLLYIFFVNISDLYCGKGVKTRAILGNRKG